MTDDLKKTLEQAIEENKEEPIDITKHPKFKKGRKKSPALSISGNGNVQIGGNVTDGGSVVSQSSSGNGAYNIGRDFTQINYKAPKSPPILPPPDSIGADPLLKQNIQTLFNRLAKEREKRFGKSAYPVMYINFKRDFGIKGDNKWTIIWTWPKQCAPKIIKYLQKLYDDTIAGRCKKAWARKNQLPKRPVLYKRERELLSLLGFKMDGPEVKERLFNAFSVTSHKHLTDLQHWQFVQHLEGQADKLEQG